MTLEATLRGIVTRIGTQFNTLRTEILGITGLKADLTTTAKGTLVAAINEVKASVSGAGAVINDVTPSGTTVYSSNKTATEITSAVAAVKSDILGGAGAAYDTLKELQDLLVADDSADASFVTATNTALGNRVRFDASQTLTAPQKAQANTNMGSLSLVDAGDLTVDFVAVFNAALTS